MSIIRCKKGGGVIKTDVGGCVNHQVLNGGVMKTKLCGYVQGEKEGVRKTEEVMSEEFVDCVNQSLSLER